MRIEVGLDLLHFALVRFLLSKKSYNSVNKLNIEEAQGKISKLPLSNRMAPVVTVSCGTNLNHQAVRQEGTHVTQTNLHIHLA